MDFIPPRPLLWPLSAISGRIRMGRCGQIAESARRSRRRGNRGEKRRPRLRICHLSDEKYRGYPVLGH